MISGVRPRLSRSRALALALATGLVLAAPITASARQPPIEHVFIVVIENSNFADSFEGDVSEHRYLAKTLPAKGAFLTQYYGIGHDSEDNYLAMVSGQPPNPQTQADCQFYTDWFPPAPNVFVDGDILVGQGCVYPPAVSTIANQLEAEGYSWKSYMEEMAKPSDRPGEPAPCRHPEIGQFDGGAGSFTDGYVTKHNPFVYFHSIIDFPTCDRNIVDYSELKRDLRRVATTPNYSFISPTMCNDGHNEPCDNGKPGGLETASHWLSREMPRILRSRAFRKGGLLIVAFDEAHSLDDCIAELCANGYDSSACCNEQPGPNTPNPGGLDPGGPGGGRTGAVLISPCIRPRTVSDVPYNHYSLLRSMEDLFGLPHLGYAAPEGLEPFGRDIFNRRATGRGTARRCGKRH